MNVSITDYGAYIGGDLQTAAIQQALDAVFLAGGGTVRIPRGIWRTGGLRLRSNTTLYLETGAILEGSRDPEQYLAFLEDTLEPVDAAATADQQRSVDPCSRWNNALIRAIDAEDIAIIGEPGSYINGMNCFDPTGEEEYRGPHAINMQRCKNIRLEGYTIYNSSNWAHAIFIAEDITIRHVTVYGGHDGFDVRTCDRVLVEDCAFYTGDDGVAGFDNYDVTVRRCLFNTACSALRFGGTKVLVEDCRGWAPAAFGFRGDLSQEQKAAGVQANEGCRHNTLNVFLYYCDFRAEIRHTPGDIVIRNCTFENADNLFDLCFNGKDCWCLNRSLADITFENCRVTGLCRPMTVWGDEKERITLRVKDSLLAAREDSADIALAQLKNFDRIEFERVTIEGFRDPHFVRLSEGKICVEGGTPIRVQAGDPQ